MIINKTILIYSDASTFGGLERLAIFGARALLEKGLKVSFLVYEGNSRFIAEISRFLGSYEDHSVFTHPVHFSKWHSILPQLFEKEIEITKNSLTKLSPDLVLLAQGRIEACILGSIGAQRAGLAMASYIPFAHSATVSSGRAFWGRIRDFLNRAHYARIKRFITVYKKAERDIKKWFTAADVRVVPNFSAFAPSNEVIQTIGKGEGLARDKFVFAIVGRIEFKQKGQDIVLKNLSFLFANMPAARLLVVGTGPDEDLAKQMVQAPDTASRVTFCGWSDDVGTMLQDIDCLLIPSRFEGGVPLVLLEALTLGVPVIGSAVDGIPEALSSNLVFDLQDMESLRATMTRVYSGRASEDVAHAKEWITSHHTRENFSALFYEAITHFLNGMA